jgi:hypothetical protein
VVFEQVAILPYWLTHLAGCRQLRKLQIHLRGWRRYAADHPASVAAAVLQLAPGLVSLRFTGWREGGRVVWKAQPALLPAPAPVAAAAAAVVAGAGAGPGAAAEAPHVPRQWRPQGALLALTGLQELQADPNAVLVLRTAADWQGLALLGALTILEVGLLAGGGGEAWHIFSGKPPTAPPAAHEAHICLHAVLEVGLLACLLQRGCACMGVVLNYDAACLHPLAPWFSCLCGHMDP